jgi:hypothetical protein
MVAMVALTPTTAQVAMVAMAELNKSISMAMQHSLVTLPNLVPAA